MNEATTFTEESKAILSSMDHVIAQSPGVLSVARPLSVYHPPAHITPELADDIVLYKDGEC